MSIVSYYIPCPRCDFEYAYASQSSSGEFDISCFKCGYLYIETPESEENCPIKTYGAYAIKYKDGKTEIGPVCTPINNELIFQFFKYILGPNIDINKCYLTRWIEMKKSVVFIFGNNSKVLNTD